MNQFEAAAAIGVGRDRYFRIENGYTEPTADECRRLARFFRTPVEQLFPGREAVAS